MTRGREREGEGGREDGPMNIIFILRLRSREMKRRHSLLLLLSVSLVLVDRTTNAVRQFRQGPARNKKTISARTARTETSVPDISLF